ncbi:MAG: hypothetical protein ACI35V_09490 [Sphingobacterium composti]|uniref:hypothetical protein n=1 Tax=Sphingobacterium composti TaxID=363260 RepID=UPI00135A8066|nr:hypothetical protein [Sphingobacterium composti Ten et al. 2007 non Yoo et al. 2007]
MKLRFAMSLGILLPFFAFSQYCPPTSGKLGEYSPFHVTAGYGITKMYGDINNNSAIGGAGTIQLDYQFIRGLYIGVETQFGSLKTEVNSNAEPRQSHNSYFAGGLVLTAHPFQLVAKRNYMHRKLADDILESFFVGVGSFYLINNYDHIYRNVNDPSTYGPIEDFDENQQPIFKTRTRTLILPSLNVGSVIPLTQRSYHNANILSLVVKAQFNFGQNDLLDGYTPYNSNGRVVEAENDVYNFYSLGLRYSF